ncbi:MAG TPA: glutamate decarboxylase [Acidimicrobiales bacterium]|nr:glutamate decarboxylase [Acidimicrobiales bacterium]
MALHTHDPAGTDDDLISIRPQFCQSGLVGEVPRLRLPDKGMPPRIAYQVVHDELLLDGAARLNLATFVTTWMEPEAELLFAECSAKNMIDKDEYPQTAELERRCVNMIAHLWHAPEDGEATGCSTTGSSEACMLAGLALLHRWRTRAGHRGGDGVRPNLVLGANAQVCWEKFCQYFDVEARLVPVSAATPYLTAETAVAHCDEATIGVVAILGSTYDGSYEPVEEIAAALDELAAAKGLDIPVHVDAASGGFIAPFLDPELRWDFRLARVQSINASGHKFGLVYPGVGWALWRDASALPDELVFKVDYLGGEMPTFTLNFSRPGAQVVGQYYNFLRLGTEGYRDVQATGRRTATWLADAIGELGPFSLLSRGADIPAFAFRLTDPGGYNVYDLSDELRTRGWIVPAYTMPPAIEDTAVLRVVVRNGFSQDLAVLFLSDLGAAVDRLGRRRGGSSDEARTAFHH